jgi:hypothetical protein
MIIPYVFQLLEQLGIVLCMLRGVLVEGRGKGGKDEFGREPIQVLHDEVDSSIVKYLAMLREYHLVREAVVLLEGQGVRAMVLDFTDVVRELGPDLVDGDVGAMLSARDWYEVASPRVP